MRTVRSFSSAVALSRCAGLVLAAAWLPAAARAQEPDEPRRGQQEKAGAAADEGAVKRIEEVVVTARRREELLQDVPISMTVFDQKQLDDRNIVNAGDLAAFTPSLSVNRNFGDDSTSFAIRGFTQELRTTPSVAVYFAEVVAPRGGGSDWTVEQ